MDITKEDEMNDYLFYIPHFISGPMWALGVAPVGMGAALGVVVRRVVAPFGMAVRSSQCVSTMGVGRCVGTAVGVGRWALRSLSTDR
jgi:hypothetical protein